MTIAAILNGQGGRSVATMPSSASVGDAVAFLAEHGIGRASCRERVSNCV